VSGAFKVFNAEANGANDLTLNIQTDQATLDLTSASKATGHLSTGPATFTLDGSSSLTLDGTGTSAIIDASSASSLKLPGFSLGSAAIHLSGASSAEVNVSGKLDVNLSSASTLTYHGNPTLGSSQISGNSVLKQAP
jgi:hypothetical protein